MLRVPDYNGRHRTVAQQRVRLVPVALRPSTWIFNAILAVASVVDIVALSTRVNVQ